MFRMLKCEDAYLDEAPFGWEFIIDSHRSADKTFDMLLDAELEREWFPNYAGCSWKNDQAGGVGSTRLYRLKYARFTEEVSAWEPGKHFQFWMSSSTLPFMERFLEDYRFEERGPSECTLRWRIRYTPRGLWSYANPVLQPLFGRDFNTASRNLTRLFS